MRAVLILALLLTGCATPEPRVVFKEVRVPVAVACRINVPAKPSFADEQVAIDAPIDEKARAYAVGLLQRIAYQKELEAAARACS